MNKLLFSIIILFSVLFLSLTQVHAENIEIEYENIDPKEFNDSLQAGKYEAESRLTDPVSVSLKFIGPFEGLNQKIIRKNESAEASDTTQIIIINEGLLDDSVQSIKYKFTLKKTNKNWLVQSAEKAQKCWPGRGHINYSPKPCN